jgi:hypothetical protein
MRPIEPCGKWGAKSHNVNGVKVPTTDWNDRANVDIWRESWAEQVNAYLERENHTVRIDHRSHRDRGLEELPTVHMGVAACQMERKGIRTERGNRNRQINSFNKELRQLKARLIKLDSWLKEESANDRPPSLYDVIQSTLDRKARAGKSQHYQSIYNVKATANMLNFLTENSIEDFAGLEQKVKSMHGRLSDVRNKLNPVERRLKTLDEHINQAENYKNYKPTKKRYDELHAEYSAAKKATGLFTRRNEEKVRITCNEFYENNRSELYQFDKAEQYLKDVMQERFNPKKLPPITKWKDEYKKLTAEKDKLYREYYSLKNEVAEVEKIKRSVYDILREEKREQQRSKSHEMEL